MKRWLESYPIHTFLILPYLAIFLYTKNAHVLSINMTFRPLLVSLVVSGIIFLISYFLFAKKILKAGIWSSVVLFFLANYGFIYDFLEKFYYAGYWPFSSIHRYLLLLYIIIFVVLYLFIRYSNYYFYNFTRWLNILLPTMIFFNLLFIIVNPYSKGDITKTTCQCKQTLTPKHTPDIYYFILDGYANPKCLKKYYRHPMDSFFNALEDQGFYVAYDAFANYFFTASSLPATLNMNYLSATSFRSISNNLVFCILKSMGYTIYTVNSGYTVSNSFVCSDVDLNKEIINEYERSILKKTIFRLDDLIGLLPYFRIKQQLSFIRQFTFQSNSPKFLFAHIVCPHPPYVFDKQGLLNPTNSFADKTWEPKEAYVDQLIYISKEIYSIVQQIQARYKDSTTKPVIVIQSDHGPFIAHSDKMATKYCRTHILNAFYVSCKDSLYPNISLVNTFRYIFKYELGLPIKLLSDSIAGISELEGNPNFINLTN